MADQASVNGRTTGRVPGTSSAEVDGIAEFIDDLASLAELQAQLAAADFRDATRKSAVPIVVTAVGPRHDGGQLPGGLLGTSWLLTSALKIHRAGRCS